MYVHVFVFVHSQRTHVQHYVVHTMLVSSSEPLSNISVHSPWLDLAQSRHPVLRSDHSGSHKGDSEDQRADASGY